MFVGLLVCSFSAALPAAPKVCITSAAAAAPQQYAQDFSVDELPYGRYAARDYIDQNGNGQLDQRGARPSDPFAISVGQGRAKPSLNMQRAAFIYSAEQHDANVPMHYP